MNVRLGLPWLLFALLSALILCMQADEETPAAPVPVRPYIAHFKITHTFALPQGGNATTVSIETVARDSKGRVYEETEPAPPGEGRESQEASSSAQKFEPNKVTMFHVNDPVASAFSSWYSMSKTAYLYQYPKKVHARPQGCWANKRGDIQVWGPEAGDFHALPAAPSSKTTSQIWTRDTTGVRRQVLETIENLGAKTIGGLTVQGWRSSFAPLPGERPEGLFVGTAESWWSDELNLALSEKSTGPMSSPQPGKYTKTKELIDLKLNEPDPALFFPPKDYSVVRVALHPVPCERK